MDVDQFGPSGLMMASSRKMGGAAQPHKDIALSQSNQDEVIRMIQQYLASHGYQSVAEQLGKESSVPMEEALVGEFRNQVMTGRFEDIPAVVSKLVRGTNNQELQAEASATVELVAQKREFMISEQIRLIEYLLFEQKYMELVAQGSTLQAIEVLQTELHQRAPIQQRLHELAQLILLAESSTGPLQGASNQGLNGEQRLENGHQEAAEFVNNSEPKQIVKLEPIDSNQTDPQQVQSGVLKAEGQKNGDCPQQYNEKEVQAEIVKYPNLAELQRHASWWQGPGQAGRRNLIEKVQHILQSDGMLQPNRLETLLQQALSYQLNQCRHHNMNVDKFSLLSNHECSTEAIPQHCIATLRAHKDQVWLVQFSNKKGDKLASVCKDGTLCVWSVQWINQAGLQSVQVKCILAKKTKMDIIQCVNWTNTSDDFLVTAGKDRFAAIWRVSTGSQVMKLDGHQSGIQAAVFNKDDSKVFTVGTDQNLIIWKIDLAAGSKRELNRIKTRYCVDMALKGDTLVSVNKTQAYCYSFSAKDQGTAWLSQAESAAQDSAMAENQCDYMEGGAENLGNESMTLEQEKYDDQSSVNVRRIEANDTITAICLSKDGQHLLANVSMQKPRLECWHLPSSELQGKYRGHEQRNYILRPAFGGLNERLVVCGSEDSAICIWHRQSCELIARISGHFQIVNSVSWSPTNALLFASASDDTSVKLWSVQHVEATILTSRKNQIDGKAKPGKNQDLEACQEERKEATDAFRLQARAASRGSAGHRGALQGRESSDSPSSSSSSEENEDDGSGDAWGGGLMASSGNQGPSWEQEPLEEEDDEDEEDDEGWGEDMEEVD